MSLTETFENFIISLPNISIISIFQNLNFDIITAKNPQPGSLKNMEFSCKLLIVNLDLTGKPMRQLQELPSQ